MISRLRGILLSRTEEGVELATPGGVVYEVTIPLTVIERLPSLGAEVELLTVHLVREDHTALYGFLESGERILFQRLLGASGVGGRLAVAMLSTYPASRLIQALQERDVGALVQVPGVGKKTAERLILELSDRVRDLRPEDVGASSGGGGVGAASAAVQALVALGMGFPDADRAVRAAIEGGAADDRDELIRKALNRP